jgi:DNA-binding HxlR family transcriptional regulator
MLSPLPPLLETLLTHRWNIAILGELHRSSGAKFVTLANRLSIGRPSLTRSLRYLVGQGLARRNSGYGHPLRPEYLLTGRGAAIGAHCHRLAAHSAGCGAQKVAYAKWSLPVLAVLGDQRARFNELREALGAISPRAQTLALKSLEDAAWITREVEQGYPPIAVYRASGAGRRLQGLLQGLCRHG